MNIRFIDLEQGSAEWKEYRKGKLGSSMASSIMGTGFKSPLQLFEDIIEDKEQEVTKPMLRGTLLEPEARQWLNNKYGSNLRPVVISHPNPEFDWHFSSIDGLWERPDGSIFVAEIKCPGRVDHQMAVEGMVPDKYIPQLYHILEDLPQVDKILYLSYHPDSQAEVWVSRNECEMHHQFAQELSFYARLLNCRPPEPTEKDWVNFGDPELLDKADLYLSLSDQISKLQDHASEIREYLIKETDCRTRARIGNLKIQKVIRPGNIDYSKIDALKGINLDEYRKKPIVTWRVSE